jgi:transcriptional regulator NrdR family protein
VKTPTGICCPRCHGKHAKVLEAREGDGYVRRRHLCLSEDCAVVETTRTVAGRHVVVKGVRWTSYQFVSPRRGAISVPQDTRAIRRVVNRAS